MLPGAALGSLAALLAVAALQALDGTRARFGAPSLMLPGCSFLLAGAALGQHFRLCTVPERVSGPPPLDAAKAQHLAASRQGQHWGSTSGSARCPSAFRGPPLDAARRSTREPRGWFLLAGAALQALDSTRARFGALMLPGASTWFGPPPP